MAKFTFYSSITAAACLGAY